MRLDDFWLFSDYSIDCHFLLARVGLDRSLLLDDGEAAQTLEDAENFVFRITYVLIKVFGYLPETMCVHAHFAQDSSSSFGVNKSVMKWKSILRIHKIAPMSMHVVINSF